MSDNYITLIPADPSHIPPAAVQEIARKQLETFVPEADEVTIRVSKKYEFEADPAFSVVLCPVCRVDVYKWFENLLDEAAEADPQGYSCFSDLAVITPCCGSSISLNDLDFGWPAGFSLFALDALNPNINDLEPDQIQELENILGCKLKSIWEHI
jgi:hypothetical protein